MSCIHNWTLLPVQHTTSNSLFKVQCSKCAFVVSESTYGDALRLCELLRPPAVVSKETFIESLLKAWELTVSTPEARPNSKSSSTTVSVSPQSETEVRLLRTEKLLRNWRYTLTRNLLLTISSRSEMSERKLELSPLRLTLTVESGPLTISLEQLPESSQVTSATSEPAPTSRTSKTQSAPSSSLTQDTSSPTSISSKPSPDSSGP